MKVSCSLAAVAVLALSLVAVVPAGATATGEISIPLRWCMVEGSPTQVDPGTADPDNPGATPNTILWRRHERATDRIYTQAGITFRSGITEEMLDLDFSKLTIQVTGSTGDIDLGTQQVDALTKCDQRWSENLDVPVSSLPGIPVINASRLLNCDCTGYGTPKGSPPGDVSDHETWSPGYVFLQDRRHSVSGDADANLVGHEIGHALGLWHTSDATNLMFHDGAGRNLSTSIQDMTDWGGSPDPFTGAVPRTVNQIDWLKTEADTVRDKQLDPPASLIPGPVHGSVIVDTLGDIPASERFIDIAEFTVEENVERERTTFTFWLLKHFTPETIEAPVELWVLLDADGNDATGAVPSQFPPSIASEPFPGVEFIALIQADIGAGQVSLKATLFEFDGTEFQETTSGLDAFLSRAYDAGGPGAQELDQEYVNLSAPLITHGNPFRVQAVTRNLATETEDRLDPALKGARMSLRPAVYPPCLVTPGEARPGSVVTVEATGLVPDRGVHVVFGDEEIASGKADGEGNVAVSFAVPSGSHDGRRLVTVGTDDTALTADCSVMVSRPRVSYGLIGRLRLGPVILREFKPILFRIPRLAKTAEITVTDTSLLPVRAVVRSTEDGRETVLCGPAPVVVPVPGAGALEVTVESGVFLGGVNCLLPASLATSGSVGVAFRPY